MFIVDKESVSRCRRIVVEQCCYQECLLSIGYEEAIVLVEQCSGEIKGFTKKEKKNHLLNKVRNSCKSVSNKGYMKPEWIIGELPGKTLSGVCRNCFCNVYEIGLSYLDVLCATVKSGYRSNGKDFNDSTPAMPAFVKHLTDLASSLGVELSTNQLAALVIPNTTESLTCFAWLHNLFEAIGDKQPACAEIHLEPTNMLDIHKEYKDSLCNVDEPYLEYSQFLTMWHVCFPHVKIREYKAVTGNY